MKLPSNVHGTILPLPGSPFPGRFTPQAAWRRAQACKSPASGFGGCQVPWRSKKRATGWDFSLNKAHRLWQSGHLILDTDPLLSAIWTARFESTLKAISPDCSDHRAACQCRSVWSTYKSRRHINVEESPSHSLLVASQLSVTSQRGHGFFVCFAKWWMRGGGGVGLSHEYFSQFHVLLSIFYIFCRRLFSRVSSWGVTGWRISSVRSSCVSHLARARLSLLGPSVSMRAQFTKTWTMRSWGGEW